MNRDEEVLVALSGGMDSAAVVLLLREAGYRPRALFLDLLDSAEARQRAAKVAAQVGVELLVEPCADNFRYEVVAYMLAEHAAGRTPSPCVRCNTRIKWRMLVAAADRLGIFHIATGHYVRTVHRGGYDYFRRGADPVKDQSYYLWGVPEAAIGRAILPLGDYTKTEVRRILGERYGLEDLAVGRESMGVCFLNGASYGDFLRMRLPESLLRPGEVIDRSGDIIGRHDGFPLYTAGQKRGFAVFDSQPDKGWTVVRVDAIGNRIVVDRGEEALYACGFVLKAWRTVCPEELFGQADKLQVVVRGVGRNPGGGCRLERLDDGRLEVGLLHDSAWALMPGQTVVFYLDDRVVGGGVVDEVRQQFR